MKIKFRNNRKSGFSRAPIWQTIYADMMTNLMLFFLMLYAMTRLEMDPRDRTSFQQVFGKEMMGRNEYSTAEVARHKMSDEDIVKEATKIKGFKEMDESNIRLALPGEVLFDSASAELKSTAAESLQQTLDIIKKIPNKIVIEGYTDDLPILTKEYSSNWELSLARAESVLNYMISSGIPRERLCISGYGEFKPMVPNSDAVSRAKNRRIEISIIKRNE
jgi:chemotaxis protein MotB